MPTLLEYGTDECQGFLHVLIFLVKWEREMGKVLEMLVFSFNIGVEFSTKMMIILIFNWIKP